MILERVVYFTRIAGIIIICYGTIMFFFPITQGFGFIGENFEWPIEYSEAVHRDRAGNYYVSHKSASRLQVYDKNKKFVKGWFYEHYNAISFINITDDPEQLLEIYIWNGKKYILNRYNLSGELLEKPAYNKNDIPIGFFSKQSKEFFSKTKWWLTGLVEPIIAWKIAFLGFLPFLSLLFKPLRFSSKQRQKGLKG